MHNCVWNYLGVGLLSVSISAAASAATAAATVPAVIIKDEGGMPRCFQSSQNPYQGFVIGWNKSQQYYRDIEILAFNDYRTREFVMGLPSCANWKELVNAIDTLRTRNAQFEIIPTQAIEHRGLLLGAEAVFQMHMIRNGSNAIPNPPLVADYLRANPIGRFTKEVNRELSYRYGMPFAAALYREWRENRPSERAFRQRVLNLAQKSSSTNLGAIYRGHKVVVVRGFAEGDYSGRTYELTELLRSLNVSVERIQTGGFAAMADNVGRIAVDLEARLRNGERLVLIGASKGVPELFAALAQLNVEQQNWPGHVEAVISISGNIGGSFLAEWATTSGAWSSVESRLRQEIDAPSSVDLRRTVESLTPAYVQRFLAPVWSRLPKRTRYFDLSAVLRTEGAVKDKFVTNMQRELFNRWFFPMHGANEGYVEYPGTDLPEDKLSQVYHLTFDASHSVLDGRIGPYVLTDPGTQERVLSAIMTAVIAR